MAASSSPTERVLPAELVAALDHPGARVAVLGDGRTPGPVLPRLRRMFPELQVVSLDAGTDRSVLHARLAASGRYRAIIVEAPNDTSRPGLFRNVFLHLEPGGVIWFSTLRESAAPPAPRPGDPHLLPYLAKVVAARGSSPEGVGWRRRDEIGMSEAVGRLVVGDDELLATNRAACYAKMREEEMNVVLGLRPDLGTVLQVGPALAFPSRATIRHNFSPYETHHEVFAVPAMSLRAYAEVVCRPGGVAVAGSMILPESFRHHRQARLRQLQAPNRSHFFADLTPLPRTPTPTRRLTGSYFYLDSEYPGHFGHFVSEVVSRLWGWAPARQQYPDLRALVSLRPGESEPPSFVREILTAAGIAGSDVTTFAADEAVTVERLVGVTPMLSMPHYVHPELATTWSTLRERLPGPAPGPYPDRIFVRRPVGSIRVCRNEDELVARFEAAGFTPVRPETMPLAEQAAMFSSASVVAGFAGSAMLGLIYAPDPVRVILVGPESYTSNNEYLIGSVLGHQIEHIGSRPDVDHPPGGWSREAFYSDYRFDFDREGELLDEVLAGLPRRGIGDRLRARAKRPRRGTRPSRPPRR